MDGQTALTLLKFVLSMAGIMGLIWLIAALTPVLARKIDKCLKKDSPARVDEDNLKEDEYEVKGMFEKSEMPDFDPNYKIYNTDIYGIEALTKRAQKRKQQKNQDLKGQK